jgi:hypothetical protein
MKSGWDLYQVLHIDMVFWVIRPNAPIRKIAILNVFKNVKTFWKNNPSCASDHAMLVHQILWGTTFFKSQKMSFFAKNLCADVHLKKIPRLFDILKYVFFIIDASTPGRRNFVFCSIQFCKLLYEFASPRQVIVPRILISHRKKCTTE